MADTASAQVYPSRSDASIRVGRKVDIPELRRGRQELHGNERAFLVELGGAHHVDLDLLLGPGIFENEFRSRFQTLSKDDHATGGADGMCRAFNGLVPALQVNPHGDAQEDALRSAALFRCGLALQSGARRVRLPRAVAQAGSVVRTRLHSSSPQKSISGATSSTPYSQPSGRD